MNKYAFPILIILITGMLAGCGPEFIDQHDRIRILSDTDIHSGPGQQFRKIGTVRAGSELILLESENDWHRVRLSSGQTGWIFRGVAQTIGPEKIVVIEDARIRRGPGEEYSAFAIAKKGRSLDARGQRGNWYLVDLPNGQSGWISKQDVRKESSFNLTPRQNTQIYQSPSPNAPVLMTANPGTELIQLRSEGNYYQVRLPGGSTGWVRQSDVTPVRERNLIVKERAAIKHGPSINYETAATVEKGTRLTVLSQRGDWYQVRTPQGKTGWIYKDFIVQSTTIASEAAPITVDEAPLYYVANTDCNIRQGPGTNNPILTRVKKGTILVRVGQLNEWFRVRLPDQRIGWVREDLVDYAPNVLITVDQSNIRRGPSTDFLIQSTVPKGTPLVKITEQDGWSKVYLPNGETGWIRNDLGVDTEQTLFTNQDCNVRDGPGTNYAIIERLRAGTPVIRVDKKNEWYQVRLPSRRMGWIREDLLRETPNQMVTNDRVNLRMGPGQVYQIITLLERNTPITVIGEDGDWYQVRLNDGRTGWIRKDMVSFSYYPGTSSIQSLDSEFYGSVDSYSSDVATAQTARRDIPSAYVWGSKPVRPAPVKITTTSAVNLRLGPSTDETVIKLLPAGTTVMRIDKRGEWYEVQTSDGTLGFAHESGFASGQSKIYTATSANLRYGPSTDYRVIRTLPEKTELTRLEQRDDWLYVQLASGEKGWVHKDLVGASKAPSPVPPLKTEPVSGSLITTEEAKILQGPDETHPTVKIVKLNTELRSLSKYRNWYEVETFDGQKGWIMDKYVREKENKKIIVIRKTEVRQEPNTQSSIVALVDVAQFYQPLMYASGWYRIQIKPGSTGWISEKDVMDLKYPEVYVNTNNADVMRFPDEKSSRVAVLKEGIQLIPLDENDEWLFVDLPSGDKGWIKKRLVNRQKHPRIQVVRDTQAYDQPSAGSILRSTLIKGDEFLALDFKNNWYKILLRGNTIGWVYGGHVKEITKGTLLVKENSLLRMGPGQDFRHITTVPAGERVKWLDQRGGWSQVQIKNGEVGWIYQEMAKNITLPPVTAQRTSPVYAGPGTNYAKVGEVIRGKQYAPIERRQEWYHIELFTGTSGWVPVSVFSQTKSRVVFTLDKANIYSGPGTHYAVVQQLQPAVDVTIIGMEGNWYHVQLQDGKRGYIRKDMVFDQ
ncbi:MAG: SH3 domain-containing protein [candidate division KSB1 bacterium]|nr:SH3 domain-containing protein [candidate division KSB1 bacterium]MDZ7334725.1 SH3 domain-containing protein [candidate division KSB1 bacterium]MDZ7358257.1 SH3 domain-containing protein [candidate division KSB1 bacterium]MDZ7400372.1 SH3 domain-containing protein [candidate division KSB1 bacterium]